MSSYYFVRRSHNHINEQRSRPSLTKKPRRFSADGDVKLGVGLDQNCFFSVDQEEGGCRFFS